MLEVYALRKVGARAHSFEELAVELEHYPGLRGVCWSTKALEELYSRTSALLEKKEFKEFMDTVVEECEELLRGWCRERKQVS